MMIFLFGMITGGLAATVVIGSYILFKEGEYYD